MKHLIEMRIEFDDENLPKGVTNALGYVAQVVLPQGLIPAVLDGEATDKWLNMKVDTGEIVGRLRWVKEY